MTRITDFLTYRNGGIEFTVSGTTIDGRYCILYPNPNGFPFPVVRDGQELPAGSSEMAAVAGLLEGWLDDQLSPEAAAALAKLDSLPQWQNLPDRLIEAVLLRRVRWIIGRLHDRPS